MKTQLQKTLGDRTIYKSVKNGFSWTTFFFGFFVPLLRGMGFGYVFKMWILAIFTVGLSNIYFAFVINDNYYIHLLENGYKKVV